MRARYALIFLLFSGHALSENGPDGASLDENFHACTNLSCGESIVSKFHTGQRALTGTTVYGETFYTETGLSDDHKTMFPPTRVISVYNPYTGEILKPLSDYIQTDNGIKLTPSSGIKKAPLGFTKNISDAEKNSYGVRVTPEFQSYQYAVTYEKEKTFKPLSYGNLGTLRSRIGKELLKITFFGDSITLGANATSIYAPPNQPGYAELTMAYLNATYPTLWEYRNNSVGGFRAQDALPTTSYRVNDKESDLVVVAFGMNDSTKSNAKKYKENLQKIISTIRSKQPGVPILLVSSILANPDSSAQKSAFLPSHLKALRELTDENPAIALVDLTTTWQMMLKTKEYNDITGNGLNHPNDFGHRIIAESVLSAILGDDY